MNIKLPERTVLVAGAQSAAARKCRKNLALLKVSYSIDQNGWNSLYGDDGDLDWKPDPALHLRPSGNVGNSTKTELVRYSDFEDVVDFEACMPRDGACLELTVSAFPVGTYDITWDGEAVEVGPRFTWYSEELTIASTEIGGFCAPVCDEAADALLDFQFWTSAFPQVDVHRVEDSDGEMILGCNAKYDDCDWHSYSLYKHRQCLPKGKCYQFLIGGDRQWIPNISLRGGSFSLTYDGELVGQSDSFLFESLVFGEDCLPRCDPGSKSAVEFFMYKDAGDNFCELPSTSTDMDFSWELNITRDGSPSTLASSGVVPFCSNESLYREVICIPKESCAVFSMSSKIGSSTYSLDMDGVSYRKLTLPYSTNGLDQTTNLGSCAAETLCNPTSEVLFQVDLLTPKEFVQNGMHLSAISWDQINWAFEKRSHDDDDAIRSIEYTNAGAYDLGSVYRAIECVPDVECEYNFNIAADSSVESYGVKRNGGELSVSYKEIQSYSPREVTQFGENCNSKKELPGNAPKKELSGGANAGIVIACIAALFVFVCCNWYCFLCYVALSTKGSPGRISAGMVIDYIATAVATVWQVCRGQRRPRSEEMENEAAKIAEAELVQIKEEEAEEKAIQVKGAAIEKGNII